MKFTIFAISTLYAATGALAGCSVGKPHCYNKLSTTEKEIAKKIISKNANTGLFENVISHENTLWLCEASEDDAKSDPLVKAGIYPAKSELKFLNYCPNGCRKHWLSADRCINTQRDPDDWKRKMSARFGLQSLPDKDREEGRASAARKAKEELNKAKEPKGISDALTDAEAMGAMDLVENRGN